MTRPPEARNNPEAPGNRPGASAADMLVRNDPESEDFGGPSGLIGEARWMTWLERLLGLAPAVILFAMMVLTFVNVFMRYLFRQPISGAFEIMSYMMGLMVFLSLVLVAARSDHVRISVLDGFLPFWLRRARAVLFNLIMAAICAGLGWRLWLYGERLTSWGDKTQMYGLPNGLLAKIMAGSTLICAVLFVALAVMLIWRRDALHRVEG
ncbi:MAG: TRAP transporter small permease [Pararhodobacter sp.]|nr:TRAP transporter small permease [Pararhodobacter sp.]